MRVPPVAFGYDEYQPPNLGGGLRGVLGLHRWLIDNTNLRIAGGYASIDAWGDKTFRGGLLPRLWQMGFAVSIFDNSPRPQTGAGGAPQPGRGTAAAQKVNANAQQNVPSLLRAVVYIDNEDNNAGLFANLVDFYKELFHWLEQQPPDQVKVRPGFYGKLWVTNALLAEFPYLYVCDVQYPRGWDVIVYKKDKNGNLVLDPKTKKPIIVDEYQTTFDAISVDQQPNGQITFHVSRHDALPASMSDSGPAVPAALQGSRGPKRPWRAWPAVYQWEGNNAKPLAGAPATVTVDGSPQVVRFDWKVDYESALVDDPAYPSVSPRLRLSPGGTAFAAQVVRKDPPVDQTRQGERVIKPVGASGSAPGLAEQPSPIGNVAPGVRPWLLQAGSELVLFTPRFVNFELVHETHRLDSGTFKPLAAALMAPPGSLLMSVHAPWSVVALSAKDAFLFAVADEGSLVAARGDPLSTSAWPSSVHVARAVHQYSQLAATHRGDLSVDTFFIGADRALHTAWWNPSLPWPSGTNQAIGSPDVLLPTTNLAAVSPNPDTLLVFGVGYDLRLNVASWSNPGPWAGPVAIGAENELLAPHTGIAALWNANQNCCEVLCVGMDLSLCLYQAVSTSAAWRARGPRFPLFTAKSGTDGIADTAPNPFGDVDLAIVGNRRIAAAAFADRSGSVARWMSSDARADASITTWSDPQNM